MIISQGGNKDKKRKRYEKRSYGKERAWRTFTKRNDKKGKNPKLTRVSGAPVENNQDSMTAGRRSRLLHSTGTTL